MLEKLEHIGIAVRSLEASGKVFEALLGSSSYKTEEVAGEQVRTAFFDTGNTKIELLECMSGDGVISKFLEKKGEGIHHLAFEVKDIYAAMREMEAKGFTLINKEPKKGADDKLVCFLHPKSTNGVLIELCSSLSPKSPL